MTTDPPPQIDLKASWDHTPEMAETWAAYDKLARNLPQCEHVRTWEEQTAAAREAYRKASRRRDRLWNAQVKASLAAEDPAPSELPARPLRGPHGAMCVQRACTGH